MDLIKPPALRKGDTIGIVAPSSSIEADKLDAGVAVLRDYGFNVQIHPQTLARERQSAGSPREKAAALHEMFLSPDVKAIIGARGGNQVAMALGSIDFSILRANPKIYMGFSDSTALQAALWSKAGLSSVHGPFVKGLPTLNPVCLDYAFGLLAGKTTAYPLGAAQALHEGTATGPVFGGTMSLLTTLVGTGYLPDLTGAILFIEDINEELSRIDRSLWQLRQVIPFESLGGLVFGKFITPLDTGRPYGATVEEIIRERTEGLDIPTIMDAPFSHDESDFYAFPLGVEGRLQASADSSTLTFTESVVSP